MGLPVSMSINGDVGSRDEACEALTCDWSVEKGRSKLQKLLPGAIERLGEGKVR